MIYADFLCSLAGTNLTAEAFAYYTDFYTYRYLLLVGHNNALSMFDSVLYLSLSLIEGAYQRGRGVDAS